MEITSTQVGECSYKVQRRRKCGEVKLAERWHIRTHQVRHSSTRTFLRNMKDGFCKATAARIKYGEQCSLEYRFILKLRFSRSTAVDAA